MILVAGGTGRLGRTLVGRLTRGGHPVRVLTRDPARAAGFDGSLVEIVIGDVRDPRAVDAAVRGTRVVVSAVHGLTGRGSDSPTTIDVDGNRLLVEAARRHAVERFVLVSVQGAGPRHPLGLARAKHVAEQAVRASGIPATIVRPTAFAELWLHLVGDPLVAGGAARVFGSGRNPVNLVCVDDVAALVEAAIADPAAVEPAVEIGGPDDLGLAELAAVVAAVSGWPLRTSHVPLVALRALSVLARPVAPAFARQAAAGVVLDTADLTFDAAPYRRRYPSLPLTPIAEVARREFGAVGQDC